MRPAGHGTPILGYHPRRMRPRTMTLCALLALARPAAADLVPSENLVADGIPPIADSIVAEAAAYGEARAAQPLAWHPQRREVLISTRFAETPQLHLVAFPGGDRRQLTFFPDRITGALFPP